MSFNTGFLKCLFNVFIFLSVLIIFFYTFLLTDRIKESYNVKKENPHVKVLNKNNDHNIWLILTKVLHRSPLTYKFKNLIENLVNVSSVTIKYHIFVDDVSKEITELYINEIQERTNKKIFYKFYDVAEASILIEDIVSAMTPHFSSKPGTYYSDALFYLSLGLYRIASKDQERAVMLDCDLYFKEDVALLFEEFDKFKPDNLYGIAPELTPVYRHILHRYKTKHNTTFGEYYHPTEISKGAHPRGYQGYNSGVLLINLRAIRNSKTYPELINASYVEYMAKKYYFKGHLGDQDFYTLLGYERPELIHTMNCGFNRQLCVWWRDHGYKEVFNKYFLCDHKIVVMHGNCNTKIPRD